MGKSRKAGKRLLSLYETFEAVAVERLDASTFAGNHLALERVYPLAHAVLIVASETQPQGGRCYGVYRLTSDGSVIDRLGPLTGFDALEAACDAAELVARAEHGGRLSRRSDSVDYCGACYDAGRDEPAPAFYEYWLSNEAIIEYDGPIYDPLLYIAESDWLCGEHLADYLAER
jgi:hypothetical protein